MRRILLIIMILTSFVVVFADDDVFRRPSVQSLVIDNANIFTEQQRMLLNVKLSNFGRNASVQFWIYTTTDLHGYGIAKFAQRLGQGWNGSDKWIVIVYKPRTETVGGVALQTSSDIERLIPEKTRNRIVDQEMMPLFRKGRVYEGIDKAADVCVSLGKGELKASDYNHPKKKAFLSFLWKLFLLVALLAAITTFLIMFSKRSNDARIEENKRNSKEYNRKEKRESNNKKYQLSPEEALYFGNDDEPNPEKVKEENEIRNRKKRIVSAVLIAASLGCIFWALIVMNQYVKVPATVTSVSSQKHYGVSSSLGRVYRMVSEYVTWNITLRYYYNDAVYSGSFKMEGYNGQHLMVYCNKNNPQKCLPSLMDYWIVLIISIVCLLFGAFVFFATRDQTYILPEQAKTILPDNESKKTS